MAVCVRLFEAVAVVLGLAGWVCMVAMVAMVCRDLLAEVVWVRLARWVEQVELALSYVRCFVPQSVYN